jgi:hypothetical protein
VGLGNLLALVQSDAETPLGAPEGAKERVSYELGRHAMSVVGHDEDGFPALLEGLDAYLTIPIDCLDGIRGQIPDDPLELLGITEQSRHQPQCCLYAGGSWHHIFQSVKGAFDQLIQINVLPAEDGLPDARKTL